MARTKTPDNPRDFTGQTDQYILSIITEDMERARKFQQPYFDKFVRFFRLYNSKFLESEKRKYGANLFIPYIYNIIETTIPKLIGSVLDAKPFISYKPVGSDDEEKGKKMTTLVDFQLRQFMRAATRLYEIFKTAVIYGTAISKQTWKYEVKNVVRRREQTVIEDVDGVPTETTALKPTTEMKVMYDAPQIQNIPLESFYFDPAYTDIDSSPFVCHEYFKERHELLAGAEKGPNGESPAYKNVKGITATEKQDGPLVDRMLANQIESGDMRDGVRIWEYWTDDWKVMIANKTTVIQCIENPYYHKRKPFTKWTLIPMPNEFYGKAPIESLEDLQAELNTTRSQRIDNVALVLNKMFFLRRGAMVDTGQLVSRPNGFIEMDDVESDVKEVTFTDVTSSAYKEEEVIKQDMDITSGVHNYDRGQQSDRRETATVANLLTSASSERFKLQVMMMEEDPMSDLGRQLAELNKQFLDGEVWVRVTQDDGSTMSMPITFEDIDEEYDIISVGTAIEASVNKEIRQAQLIQLLNIAAQQPEVNKGELLKSIFEEFEFKDIGRLIQIVPPMVPGMPAQPGAPQPTDTSGQYPQMGGVGSMGGYLENPVAQGTAV